MLTAQGRSTTRKQMRKFLVAAACGALIAVAGCGGSSEDSTPTAAPQSQTPAATTAGSSTASTTTAPAVDNSADQAIADAGVLRLSDFPSGWTSKAAEDTDDEDTLDCGNYKDLRDKAVATADSPAFDQEDNSNLRQVVLVWPTEADAREVMNLFSQQDFIDCVGDTYEDRLKKAYDEQGEGLKLGDVEVSTLRVEDHGDESTGIRVATEVGKDSISVDVTADVNILRVGRAVSLITALGAFSPVSETDRMAGIVADHLSAALNR
jgi:hypothetical protein